MLGRPADGLVAVDPQCPGRSMLGRPADGLVVVDTHLEIDRRMCDGRPADALFECLLRSELCDGRPADALFECLLRSDH